MFSWIGYKKKEVLYDRDPRIAGKTKWNYIKLVDLAIDGITSFTTSPLRLSTFIAIPTFIVLFVYFVYVIVKCFVVHEAIQAFQAIILLILFFSFLYLTLFLFISSQNLSAPPIFALLPSYICIRFLPNILIP